MKRIITCSDGTWNRPGTTDKGIETKTNVEKMFNCIAAEAKDANDNTVKQVKAYDQGVGTGYTRWDKIAGGITGAGIDTNIKDMYTFICLNYQPGDEVYLFGFSRGAYTARSIAGFIRTCGVIKPDYIHLVDMAYKLYRDRNSYTHPDSDLMKAFKANYSADGEQPTPIKFIGVWDTVGALGVPLPWYQTRNKNKYQFHDVTLSSYVENAYHALAIDDHRKLFQPTIWERSKSVMADKNHPQQLEQRWFAGAHSNVGGGYADCGLSNIALQWLIDKSMAVGLVMNPAPYYPVTEVDKGEITDSYTVSYWFWKRVQRTITLNDNKTNQTLDESVIKRYKERAEYRPKSLANWIK